MQGLFGPALFLIFRLIQLNIEIAGNFEIGDKAITVVLDFPLKFNAFLRQFVNGFPDIVAIEGNVVRTGRGAVVSRFIRWVNAQIAFRKIEN